MKIIFIILVILSSIIFVTCQRPQSGTYDYRSLQFDTTKIVIFKWDSLQYPFPKYSQPLALKSRDIEIADNLLNDAIVKFNQKVSPGLYESFNRQIPIDTFVINLSLYKRQYFPYEDNNGHRIIFIICFSGEFKDWKIKTYSTMRPRGISKFELLVDLSKVEWKEFLISGYD